MFFLQSIFSENRYFRIQIFHDFKETSMRFWTILSRFSTVNKRALTVDEKLILQGRLRHVCSEIDISQQKRFFSNLFPHLETKVSLKTCKTRVCNTQWSKQRLHVNKYKLTLTYETEFVSSGFRTE